MGCINDKSFQKKQSRKQQYQSKFQNSKNPIIRIAKQWNVDIIKQRWHDNELDILRQKLGPNVNRISRDKFMTLLPSLKHFSDITINNLYDLFNFEQQQELNIDDFLIAQIIILKSDDYELLADMFLFVYSSDQSKRLLSQNDFQLFQKQFKQYQLEFLHETKRPGKNEVGQVIINRKDFREIFEQYDMKTIKILFRFDMKDEQRKFQKHLSVQGINRNSQEQTFLVDFEWFLKWKNYLEYKYGIKIDIKQNGKSLSRQKNNLFLNTLKDHQSIIQAGQRLANSQNQNYLEPVNNDRIQGQDQNELRENLIELQDFISVSVDVWKQIRILYGGGPQITKPYPNFYNKKIVLTIFDEKKCTFQVGFAKGLIYIPTQSFETIYKKRQQRYFLKQPVENVIAYYKHPGEWQWKKIQNLQISLQELPFKFKVFIVFVPKKFTQQFESSFNITEAKGKKQIKERIKNFGNLLSFQYEGLLQQGHVGNILQNSVLIYLKNQRGQYYRIQKTFKELQKLNSNTLQDQFLQGFAGLENIGNTCYINSPLQCLLKTPYFEEYLDSVNLDKTRKDMLTYQLNVIYDQCKKSRDCVSMSSFKKVFDEKFPFFEGSSQQDAQQFLLLLLDKLSQQQPRQSLMGIDSQTKKNRKIHSFFSGKTKAQTACVKCHKKGIVEQSFFTYSLSLPINNESLFSFYFIDENFKIFKHSLTINRESEIGEVIKEIENQLGIDHKHLYIMSAFQNEWMNNLNNLHSAYKIAKLENYDARVICYKIKKFQNPDQEDIAQQKDDKSVKIQIRNRCYNPKTKSYRSFHYPFYVEVDSQLTGQQLRQTVTKKIKRFINNEQYQSFKSIQGDKNEIAQKPFETSGLQKKSNKQQLNQEQQPQQMQKKPKNSQSLPFAIQYLKSEDNNKSTCWFCKKKVDSFSKQHKQKTDCEGCQFPDDQRIWKNKIFMKNYQKLVITIDWESITFSKNWAIQETKSCAQAQKLQKSRRSNLQNLLIQAYELQQSIELKCQNTNCRSDLAIRKQRIIQAPNILILHLKRFFYKDNMFHKLKNKVDIPETFVLPGFSEKYELYGNVVHYGCGTGRGGHYINYVNVSGRWYRCDDEKVHFTKQPNEHLNPDTYLLFYRRKAMDRSWSFFGF